MEQIELQEQHQIATWSSQAYRAIVITHKSLPFKKVFTPGTYYSS